jgi:hypothetical protein
MAPDELAVVLQGVLEQVAEMPEDDLFDAGLDPEGLSGAMVRTYDDVGMLSSQAGLVLHLPDGSEFQLPIVQVR